MLSDALREYRMKNGLTQSALAKKLSISQNSISQYETGKRTPHVYRLTAIADTLGCPISEIMPSTTQD